MNIRLDTSNARSYKYRENRWESAFRLEHTGNMVLCSTLKLLEHASLQLPLSDELHQILAWFGCQLVR